MTDRGRMKQKLRTRRDVLAAARALIDSGLEVSLAAVAEEAAISRATVYRYFSDPAALALEAVLDGMVETDTDIMPNGMSARERVHAVRRYWLSFYRDCENRMRVLAARAMEPGPNGAPRYQRTARRLPMFAQALLPVSAKLGEERSEELALALAATTGFEIYVTMKDVLGIDDDHLDKHSRMIVDALLEKFKVA